MIATTSGLLGCALLCLALIATALHLDRFPALARYAVAMVAIVALFTPVDGLSVLAYVRGVTGDLSVATLVLAAGACVSRLSGRTLIAPRESLALLRVVAGAGVFLYPFALGWTPFDPYALGYGSVAFITVLLLVTLAAWRAGLNLVVLVVLVASLAWLAGLYESRNLWDYLIDPLAAIYAVVRLSAGEVGKVFPRRQS
ncbi:MAG TPA: hypothetical protein VFA36_09875 [Burkholderiales bacterium]|jgi:hypothetical protein|nr:hypothetical protein [Burkholderiales bacterium]